MKNKTKVNLAEIKIQDAGATCITLVSKFSRVIKAKHGVVIQLRDPQVLNRVATYAAASNSAELKNIYQQIEIEVRQYLSSKGVSLADDITAKPRSLNTGYKSKTKSGKNGFRRI